MKRRRPGAEQTEPVSKLAKKEGGAKTLSASNLEKVKEDTSDDFNASKSAQAVKQAVWRSTRVKAQPAEQALRGLDILAGPICEPFPDPDDAPMAKARGCKRAEVTIGPRAGVPADMGTDAEGILPRVLGDAKVLYGNNFKSGHAVNADFGGSGVDYKNLTCLTNSANGQQNAFDGPIRRARGVLQHAYEAINHGKPQAADFLKNLGYGIKIVITMSDETWGDDYPDNCISTEMTCSAEVVNAPTREKLEEALVGVNKNQQIDKALDYVDQVAAMVKPVSLVTVKNTKLERLAQASAARRQVTAKRRGTSK